MAFSGENFFENLPATLSGIEGVTDALAANFAGDPALRAQFRDKRLRRDADKKDRATARMGRTLARAKSFSEIIAQMPNLTPAMEQEVVATGDKFVRDCVVGGGSKNECQIEGKRVVALMRSHVGTNQGGGEPFTLSTPGATRFDAGGNPIATLPQKPVNLPGLANTGSQVAIRMLDAGSDPADVAATLQTMGTDPASQQIVQAITESLPSSREEFLRVKTEGEMARADANFQKLKAAGVPDKLNAIISYGRGGTSIALDEPGPGELSPAEKVDMRGALREFDKGISALDRVIPQIDADTAGIWAALSRNLGGVVQQVPGVRDLANFIGPALGLDEATVTKAITAQNDFLLAIEQLKRFASSKENEGRLSNQDRDFVTKLTGLTAIGQPPPAVLETANNMRRIMAELRGGVAQELATGQIPLAPGTAAPTSFTSERGEDGKIVIKDSAGAVQFREVTP